MKYMSAASCAHPSPIGNIHLYDRATNKKDNLVWTLRLRANKSDHNALINQAKLIWSLFAEGEFISSTLGTITIKKIKIHPPINAKGCAATDFDIELNFEIELAKEIHESKFLTSNEPWVSCKLFGFYIKSEIVDVINTKGVETSIGWCIPKSVNLLHVADGYSFNQSTGLSYSITATYKKDSNASVILLEQLHEKLDIAEHGICRDFFKALTTERNTIAKNEESELVRIQTHWRTKPK
ncbi:hypothetical protein GZH52_07585 [Crenobacter sp. HX-7-9]|uniref:Uncharacterized protein n=2 Tax=Crenobacter caeni TaxID=2705474 RepID=A0A6B2KRH7_9NEIS|nr:hypothetical protein [Crenobacter caeni]